MAFLCSMWPGLSFFTSFKTTSQKPRDCRLRFTSPTPSTEANGTAVFHFVQNVFPKASGLSASFHFADFLGGHLTQSLSNKHCVFVWLFCSSSVYESKLSTQPRNKKASHLHERLCRAYGNRTRITRMKT